MNVRRKKVIDKPKLGKEELTVYEYYIGQIVNGIIINPPQRFDSFEDLVKFAHKEAHPLAIMLMNKVV